MLIPIRTWHIVISGYTQHEGALHGCMRLWQELHALAEPGTVIIQPPWDHDWDHLAQRILLTSDTSQLRVLIYAYSWGAGHGAVKLAEALKSRAIYVDRAVLSDPVYRSAVLEPVPGLGHLIRGVAVLMGRTITIPKNVRRVDWFRQTSNIPKGCDLRAENRAFTDISESVTLEYPHEAMDDAPEFRAMCLRVAGLHMDAPQQVASSARVDSTIN